MFFSRKNLILKAVYLALLCSFVPKLTVLKADTKSPLTIKADKQTYNIKEKKFQLEGDVEFQYDQLSIYSDLVTYQQTASNLNAQGEFFIRAPFSLIKTKNINYSKDKDILSTQKIEFQIPYIHGISEQFIKKGNVFIFKNAHLYYGKDKKTFLSLKINELSISTDEVIIIKNGFIYLLKIPIFPIIKIVKEKDDEVLDYSEIIGKSSQLGFFLKNTYFPYKKPHIKAGFNLDYYQKKGLLFGPKLYASSKKNTQFPYIFTFDSGFINDKNNIENDIFNERVPENRNFVEARLQASLNKINLKSHISKLSDSEILGNIRRHTYQNLDYSDSFLQANYQNEQFIASAIVVKQINDWQTTIERSPALHFNVPLRPIGESDLYYQFQTSYEHLTRLSPDPKIPTLSAERVSSYLGISKFFKFGDFIFKPIAGTHFKHYELPSNLHQNYSIHELGFDLTKNLSKNFNYQNKLMNISKPRHTIEYIAQYRHLINNQFENKLIPDIDVPDPFFPYLEPINLSEQRTLDKFEKTDRLRLSVKNTLYGRNFKNTHTRYLCKLNLHQDIYFKENRDNKYSDLFLTLKTHPLPPIEISTFLRFSKDNFKLKENIFRFSVQDSQKWRLRVDYRNINDFPQRSISQIRMKFTYGLNSTSSILGEWVFDQKTNKLREQIYGIENKNLRNLNVRCFIKQEILDDGSTNRGFFVKINIANLLP